MINDFPKIQCEDPTVDDHCVLFDESNLRMRLQLNGAFSYFRTKVHAERELHECKKLYLTKNLSDWNHRCQCYDRNERSMLYFEGNMSEPSRTSKHQVMIEDEDYDVNYLTYSMA